MGGPSPSDLVSCYIEGRGYPRAACHIHHKNPRHAGGSDAESNLVFLCATCHQLVHRAAQMVKANRRGEALDLASITFVSPAARQRFLAVVNTEVEESALAAEKGIGKDEIIVEMPIPRKEYAQLKLLVSDYRAGGKKLSISAFCAHVVLAHVRKHVR